MLTFIVVNSVWWWILTALFVIFVLWGGMEELGWMLGIDVLVYLLVINFMFTSNGIVSGIIDNPGKLVMGFIGYFVIGTGWSFFKWYLKVKRYAIKYAEKKEWFLKKHKVTDGKVTPELKNYWNQTVSNFSFEKPVFKEEKGNIAYWITYWPISAIVFLLEDLFKEMVNHIIEFFNGIYEKIERRVYSDIFKDDRN